MCPERAIVKCNVCGEEFEGEVPSYKTWVYPEIAYGPDPKNSEGFSLDLLKRLHQHHKNTGIDDRKIFGHRHFIVFLPNNKRGSIEVLSGIVTYAPDKESEK